MASRLGPVLQVGENLVWKKPENTNKAQPHPNTNVVKSKSDGRLTTATKHPTAAESSSSSSDLQSQSNSSNKTTDPEQLNILSPRHAIRKAGNLPPLLSGAQLLPSFKPKSTAMNTNNPMQGDAVNLKNKSKNPELVQLWKRIWIVITWIISYHLFKKKLTALMAYLYLEIKNFLQTVPRNLMCL